MPEMLEPQKVLVMVPPSRPVVAPKASNVAGVMPGQAPGESDALIVIVQYVLNARALCWRSIDDIHTTTASVSMATFQLNLGWLSSSLVFVLCLLQETTFRDK